MLKWTSNTAKLLQETRKKDFYNEDKENSTFCNLESDTLDSIWLRDDAIGYDYDYVNYVRIQSCVYTFCHVPTNRKPNWLLFKMSVKLKFLVINENEGKKVILSVFQGCREQNSCQRGLWILHMYNVYTVWLIYRYRSQMQGKLTTTPW